MSQSRCFSWRKAIVKSDLSGECRHLLLTLSLYMNEMGEGAYPALDTLAKDCGKSARWAKKWMKYATENGWISIKKVRRYYENSDNRGWRRNEYTACWPEQKIEIEQVEFTPDSDENLDQIVGEIEADLDQKGGARGALPSKKVVHEVQKGGAPDGKKVVHEVHLNSPVNQSNESVQEREGAQARDDAGLNEDGTDKPLVEKMKDDELEKRVIRFLNGDGFDLAKWPNWDSATFDYHKREFGKLTEGQALEAERWRDAYLTDIANSKVRPVSPGNFCRDRLWQKLTADVLERYEAAKKRSAALAARKKPVDAAELPQGYAKPYGQPWMARRMELLLLGQEIEGECSARASRFQMQRCWPTLFQLDNLASAPPSTPARAFVLGEKYHEMAGEMVFVTADSDLYAAWIACFVDFGWPIPKLHGSANGIQFPKGGPDGLEAFAEKLGVIWARPMTIEGRAIENETTVAADEPLPNEFG